MTSVEPPRSQELPESKQERVYFHAGSQPTYRTVSSATETTIPTISLTHIDCQIPSLRLQLAQELVSACTTTGFFYLSDHHLPLPLQTSTFDVAKRFFALPLDRKLEIHMHKNPAIRGYEPQGETHLDVTSKGDVKESFTMGDCPLEPEQAYTLKTGEAPPVNLKRAQNIWPSAMSSFRDGLYAYYDTVFPLALKLVRLIALGLDIDEDSFMGEFFRFPITGLRALHYPPMPGDGAEGYMGLGAHADFSYLTLVLQTPSLSALEVLTPTGHWLAVPDLPNTIVCNVGQYLERQTNGRFRAAVHRVRNQSGSERFSIPFFLTMDPGAQVKVLVEGGEERKYEDFNVGDLYIRRVLPARKKHPTSIKYRGVPEEEWRYDFLLE